MTSQAEGLGFAVVGGGAMGSIYAALLTAHEQSVWLVDLWEDHVTEIRANGLVLDGPAGRRTVRVRATTSSQDAEGADVVIVAVKAFDTAGALDEIRRILRPGGLLLSMQNGLGAGERLTAGVPGARVAIGVPGLGGRVIAPGHVAHHASGTTRIGWFNGPVTPELRRLAGCFTSAGFETETTDDIVRLQWRHVAVVAGVNAIAALCRIPNIEVARVAPAARLSELVIREVLEVADALGIDLGWSDPVGACRQVYLANGEQHLSSMTMDVLLERQTEIGVLNEAIVEAGSRVGVPTPVNEALCLAIHTIEATASRRARP